MLDTLKENIITEIKDYVSKIKSALLTIIKANEMVNQAKLLEHINQKNTENLDVKVLQDNNGYSAADELLKLSDLYKQGILTDEEYEIQKTKVLNKK